MAGRGFYGGRDEGIQMLDSTLGDMQSRRDLQQRQQQAYLLALINGQPYEKQLAILQANGGGGLKLPTTLPQTDEERYNDLVRQKKTGSLNSFNPNQGQNDVLSYDLLAGRNPNAEFTTRSLNKGDMTPEQYSASINAPTIKTQAEATKATADAGKANADAAFTAGPKSKSETAQAGLYGAQAGEATAKAGEAAQHGKLYGTQADQAKALITDGNGQVNPIVQRWVDAVKGAAANGEDPGVVLKRITDKKTAAAVGNELTKPDNAKILQQSPLAQKQRDSLAEIDPLLQQTDAVIAALTPYKDKNGLTDRMTLDYGKYRMGIKPDEDTPASQIANLQMLGVQAGSRLLKGGSRAYPALQMAMQHAPNAAVDTYANAYDKAVKLKKQLEVVRAAQLQFGQPLTAEGAAQGGGGQTAKTVTRAELKALDESEETAKASGYTVVP